MKRPFLLSAFFALLLVFGIGCRFYNLTWDEGAQLHPDERFVASVVVKLKLATPFFDSSRSPLNPSNYKVTYVYGQFPLFVTKAAAQFLPRNDIVSIIFLGRSLSAFFDSLTVLFTFLIGRRLFETKWAIFGAMCVSLAALHIQQSHFFVTDTFAATFIAASFWAGVRFSQNGKRLDAALMGIFWGLGMACKISAIFWGIGILGIFVLTLKRRSGESFPKFQKLSLLGWAFSCVMCLSLALIAFRLGNPMTFRGEAPYGFFDLRLEPRFLGHLAEQSVITRGESDVPFNAQWVGTPKWIFAIKNLGNWGYTWAILLSGFVGALLLFKRRRGELAIAVVFSLSLLWVQGGQFSKFTRYFLPMTPFIGLLAAHLWSELTQKKQFFRYGAIFVAICAGGWCLAVTSIYSRRNSRIEGSKWMVENIKPGTVVTNETSWDEGMPLSWIPTGTGGLKYQILQTYDLDTPEKREKMVDMLDKTEWIFFPSGRSWQNIPRWPEKWPMTCEFYAALWDGSLGFEKVREFTSYPNLGPIQFPDDNSEEALSVYDHPRVILWKKTKDFSRRKAEAILNDAVLPQNQQGWLPNNPRRQ